MILLLVQVTKGRMAKKYTSRNLKRPESLMNYMVIWFRNIGFFIVLLFRLMELASRKQLIPII